MEDCGAALKGGSAVRHDQDGHATSVRSEQPETHFNLYFDGHRNPLPQARLEPLRTDGFCRLLIESHAQRFGHPNASYGPVGVHDDPEHNLSLEFGLARWFRISRFRRINRYGSAHAAAWDVDAATAPGTESRPGSRPYSGPSARPDAAPGSRAGGWRPNDSLRITPSHVRFHFRQFQFRRPDQGGLHREQGCGRGNHWAWRCELHAGKKRQGAP